MPSEEAMEWQRYRERERVAESERVAREQSERDARQAMAGLRRLRLKLERLDRQRVELLAERAALVGRARAGGVAWSDVTEAAGVSRPALVQGGDVR